MLFRQASSAPSSKEETSTRSLLQVPLVRRPLWQGAFASFAINALSLITPLYFTQVYDRVLSSRSEATLVAITIVTLVVIALSSAFDLLRNLLCARASVGVYAELERRVFDACRQLALQGGSARRTRPIEDLDLVRNFIAGPLPAALMDLIYAPLFIVALFALHEALGLLALLVAIGLIAATLANRASMTKAASQSVEGFRQSSDVAEAYLRGIEPAVAMGFAANVEGRAAEMNRDAIISQMRSTVTTGSLGSLVKAVRGACQILVIALAAYLALQASVSMGAIVAASILFSKALAPLDQVVNSWRTVFQVRSAWERLDRWLTSIPDTVPRMRLPAPSGAMSVQAVDVLAPGGKSLILQGISFELKSGEALGIIGPSGSGKSTLARVLAGAWRPSRGVVRLDGADMAQIDMDIAGAAIGYVPQTLELLPGTLAENIRRFNADDAEGVVAAARAAGAHEMILTQPQGYDTVVGGPGFALSGGQRQRVGLARALYRDPTLLVLDEPDNGLDRDGEIALAGAIQAARARGATVVVIAHRPSLVASLDKILMLAAGRMQRFGKPSEILPQLISPPDTRVRA